MTTGRLVSLNPGSVDSDVGAFRRAAAEGRLEEVARIYEADFFSSSLPGRADEFAEWAEGIRRQLNREYGEVLLLLVDQCADARDFAAASRWAERLWSYDPDDDVSARTLIEMHVRAGDRPGAYAAAGRVRSHFKSSGIPISSVLAAAIADALAIPSIGPGKLVEVRAERLGTQRAASASSSQLAAEPGQEGRGETGRSAKTSPRARSKIIRRLAAVLVASVLTWSFFEFLNRSPADIHHFGGGGTLVYQTVDGAVHAIGFRGPTAADTVRVSLRNADSLLAWGAQYSPAANAVAYHCTVPERDRRNVCVRWLATGDTSVVFSSSADNHSTGWSPDGSWLLISSGRDPGATFSYDAYAVEAATGRLLRLSRDPFQSMAYWSPDGTRIAIRSFRAGGDNLEVRTVDGASIDTYRFGGKIAVQWSPDGAALLVVERQGDVYTGHWLEPGRVSRSQPLLLPETRFASLSPDGGVVVFLGQDSGRPKLAVCAVTNCTNAALEIDNVKGAVWLPSRALPFLSSIELRSESVRLLAGETAQLDIVATDSHGRQRPDAPIALGVSDRDAGWIDEQRVFHALRGGPVQLIASSGGWRADTVRMVIERRPAARSILAETWDSGLDTTRWKLFGHPLASVVDHETGRAFQNNGDHFYISGAAFRRPIDASAGLTIEWRQRTPLTGSLWQEMWLGLHTLPADSFRVGEGDPYRHTADIARVQAPLLRGQPPEPMMYLGCGLLSMPTGLQYRTSLWRGAWHDFVLQVYPDGSCALLVDGDLVIATPRERTDLKRPLTFWHGGRSWDTDLLVDHVRVWSGIRWGIREDGRAILLEDDES